MALCCSACGEERLRDEARFCDRCGAKLEEHLTLDVAPDTTRILAPSPEAILEARDFTPPAPAFRASDEASTTRLVEMEAADGSTTFLPPVEATDQPSPLASPTLYRAAVESASTADFQPGYLLQERYRLEEMLGAGGFGIVYLASDVKLERRCVVKRMLIPEASLKEEIQIYQANFEREAKLLAELNDPGHPNIPEVYDYFSTESGNYLVMKYIEGRNLLHILLDSGGKIGWREAIGFLVDVCSALNYMHTQQREPAIHRDIKPANIVVGGDRRVWLVDFGLAKAEPVEDKNDAGESLSAGSLGYTPLEQWQGRPVPASDIYALGVTLHYLITGINPRDDYQEEATLEKVEELHGQLPPIREVNPGLPAPLEEIIRRATALDPDDRPTALQFQQQLLALVSGNQVVPLFTFRNGQSARTVKMLVDLCDAHRLEAIRYLYGGDFERWFTLINRNDLAGAAHQAVKYQATQKEGLEKFLKLILPNLALRRLARTSWRLAVLAAQVILTAVVVILIVAVVGSYGASWFVQRSISKTNWDFNTLDLEHENHFTEKFLSEKMEFLIGAYLDHPQVEVRAPDQLQLEGHLVKVPLAIHARLQMGDKEPQLFLTDINGIPLLWFGENISRGINRGIKEAFYKGPVDVTQLMVQDNGIIFNIEESQNPLRPAFATATPTLTPTPTPSPTPTPVPVTLVVVSNDLAEDVILEVVSTHWSRTLDITANTAQILETPPGLYHYVVKYKNGGQIAAQGDREWVLNKAYRLRIDLPGQP